MSTVIIQGHKGGADYVDLFVKFATISIAFFNAYFAVTIFRLKDKKDELEKEKDRKIQLLKTLVLDHSLKKFYEKIDEITNEISIVKNVSFDAIQRQQIDEKIADHFIVLRREFYDLLLGIDGDLHTNIKNIFDDLQSHLSLALFDQGINISHGPKFDEIISEHILDSKNLVIKTLFTFR